MMPAERSGARYAWGGSVPSIALIGGLIALLLLGLGMSELSRQQVASSRRMARALEVGAGAAMVRADLETVSSEGRAFLLHQSDSSRDRFAAAVLRAQDETDRLRTLVAGDPAQVGAIDRLDPLIKDRVAFLRRSMDVASIGGEQAAAELARTGRGREMMDRIVATIGIIEAEESRKFGLREKASRTAEQWLVVSLVGCGVLAAASLLLAIAISLGRSRERAYLAGLEASAGERRRSEVALRDSEARFRAMADTVPNLLFEADAVGSRLYVNSSMTEYSGAQARDFIPRGWLRFIHPGDRRLAAGTLSRAVRSGASFEIACRCRRHDGAFRWFLCRSVAVRDASGAITHWIGALTDIDDQKQAASVLSRHRDDLERLVDARTAEVAVRDAELHKNAELFRLIAEHSHDMVLRVGADGAFVYVSPASQRLLGLSPVGLTREVFLSRVYPDDLPAVVALRARLLSGKVESETLVYRLRHIDGHIMWVEAALRVVRGDAGAPDGFISVLRDTTERRDMDESLRHAQKMEIIGRISSGVAHDFNNLLQTVIGGLQLTLDSMEVDAPGREFADLAFGAATRGCYLSHHLLSYARKQLLQPRVVELGPFLTDLRRLLSRTLGPHLDVRIELSNAVPSICVDPNQLQSALLNLAINAADAMPEGGVLTIGADAGGAEADAHLVTVRVSDTGTGMDAGTLAQACEPFFTTKGIDGTGLGLSMVQGFAEQSGGRLQIETQLGCGTTIVLLFPAVDRRVQRPGDPATLPQPSRRVLVVDDEPDVLVTAGAFLERAGLWVVRASSGNEALALLGGSLPFDVMVTDYAMPGMNGADLAREGQAIRPGLPVLIMTGFAEVRELASLPANVRMLHKPFMRDDLLKALRQVMLVGDDAFPIG